MQLIIRSYCRISCCSWSFKTDDRDVGFGVQHKSEDGTEKELIPNRRVDSHIIEQDGTLICETAGKCKLILI